MKTRQRLLAVMLLIIGPVWFALAPARGERQELQTKDDQQPAKKQLSLAEIARTTMESPLRRTSKGQTQRR